MFLVTFTLNFDLSSVLKFREIFSANFKEYFFIWFPIITILTDLNIRRIIRYEEMSPL